MYRLALQPFELVSLAACAIVQAQLEKCSYLFYVYELEEEEIFSR